MLHQMELNIGFATELTIITEMVREDLVTDPEVSKFKKSGKFLVTTAEK